jgi:protein-S-isoprenylcysteine O-methyltransferase Ste14
MQDRTRGHLFVAAQVLLLGAMVLPVRGAHWTTPGWLEVAGLVAAVQGIAICLLSGKRLAGSLTANPVPVAHGELETHGPYARVRHPIYSGLLLLVLGIALRSGNALTVLLAALILTFFHAKAAWEERLLAQRYPEYSAYAARTPRFVPRLGRRAS